MESSSQLCSYSLLVKGLHTADVLLQILILMSLILLFLGWLHLFLTQTGSSSFPVFFQLRHLIIFPYVALTYPLVLILVTLLF
jgi:hypothetical protein